MKRIKWMTGLLVSPSLAANAPAVVGRVYYIEGDLLRYIPDVRRTSLLLSRNL